MPEKDEAAIDQVAGIIRERIQSNVYGSDGILPSTSTLGDELKFHRVTVGEALAMLRSEGLLRFEKHRYVVDNVRFTMPGFVKNFPQWVQDQGYAPTMENIILPEIVAMDSSTASLFELPVGYQAVHRIRRHNANNIPLCIAENWYPSDLAGEMLLEMTENPAMDVIGTIKIMRGVSINETIEDTVSRIPTKRERDWLKLSRYQPVLEILRKNIAEDGQTVMLNRLVYVGTKFKLHHNYSVDHWS